MLDVQEGLCRKSGGLIYILVIKKEIKFKLLGFKKYSRALVYWPKYKNQLDKIAWYKVIQVEIGLDEIVTRWDGITKYWTRRNGWKGKDTI